MWLLNFLFFCLQSFHSFSLMNLLKWYWLIKLYRLQVHNSIIPHLHIVLCVHHLTSDLLPPAIISHLPSSIPFTHHPLWLSLLFMSMSFFVFVFCFCFIPSPFTPSPLNPFPSDSGQSPLCLYESVSILFVSSFRSLDSTYEWTHMVLVFLSLAFFT